MSQVQNLITEHLDTWTQAIETKSSAGRGSSNKFTLLGIKKLRELILEMAVRGLLVPQDPNDEPASVLLEKIAAEKTQLFKDGKIKKTKALPEIGEDEKPFELPNGWEWMRVGSIAQHNAGKTLDKARNKGLEREYLTTSNVYWGKFDLTTIKKMPILDNELEKCEVKKGDLLICEGGEAGRAAVWSLGKSICIQNHIHRVRVFAGISPYFIYRYFEKMAFSGEIENHRKGVGISNMSGKALASIVVAIPPVEEQKRIVAKVDELMVLCDQLEQQTLNSIEAHQALVETLLNELVKPNNTTNIHQVWSLIAENFDVLFTTEKSIDTLKQTILQLAVMGKLVPQNPNDEPASKLLQKIATEKAQLIKDGKIKKSYHLPPITDNEKPFEVPNTWVWSRLDDVAVGFQYGSSAKSSKLGQVPVLRMGNIQKGEVDWGNLVYSNSDAEIQKYSLVYGDLLFNRTNSAALVGKTAIYRGEREAIYAGYLIRVSMLSDISAEYANLVLNSPMHFEWCDQERTVGVNQSNINATKLKSYVFPLPPFQEQSRIVGKVDELMTICDQLKVNLQSAQQTQTHLAQSIAQEALS